MFRQELLTVHTRGRGFVEISDRVRQVVADSACRIGLCHLFLRHTSASLCLCENAAPAVRVDLETWAQTLAPDSTSRYRHDEEGADDMPAHIRSIAVGVELSLPVRDRALLLGTWQGIYLWEHRLVPHDRQLVLTLNGEFDA